ncbi:protein mushroom body miniature-like [Helianthus annuus]|uniref:protein mushroom body miniature-like n=1 Tax=Helianthus annuus TaxID=4232 RepID=UPI000B8F42ED|nr:protein mushroom body miniature-like [Helianthus annuus]
MADSDEINSHPLENHDDNDRVNITKGELRSLINTAVSKAVEEQLKEYSETHSRASSVPRSKSVPKTHSEPHNKPPSKNEGPKKDDDRHSSNEHSVPSKKPVFDNEPHAVRLRSLKKSEESKRKREDDNSRGSEKKRKGNTDSKKFGSGRNSQQTEEKPKCMNCQRRHFGKCRLESNSNSGAPACGICKSKEHKSVECKKIKDTTCYNCNEKGHIKTNCPKYAKKPEEVKKTNARVFRLDAKEAILDDTVITATFFQAVSALELALF